MYGRATVLPIETIEPRRLYRQVADQLRKLIDDGEFAVGARLPTERELAMKLGISRPTVREALIALEVDGRVRIRVGSGIYVLPAPAEPAKTAPAPIAGPFELLNARAVFEGAVAEEVARVASAADLAAIDRVLDEMAQAQHPGPNSMVLDRAFHTTLADILGNDAVTRVVGDLFDQRIHPYFAQLASYFENSDSWHSAMAEHREIRDCIAARDPAAARAAMRKHLENSQIRFSESFGAEPKAGVPLVPSRGVGRQKRALDTAKTTTTRQSIRRK